ncbi:hypothetical protein PtB15_2B156 [Puccinia triticina]|nr:hypothetical protein PtB15_2B156 [Puccinia triticina]
MRGVKKGLIEAMCNNHRATAHKPRVTSAFQNGPNQVRDQLPLSWTPATSPHTHHNYALSAPWPCPPLLPSGPSPPPPHTRLAIGCDHGAIRIGAIADNQLELVCKLDPCNTPLLSLAWGISPSKTPPPLQEPNDSQLFLVAGGADSSLGKPPPGEFPKLK